MKKKPYNIKKSEAVDRADPICYGYAIEDGYKNEPKTEKQKLLDKLKLKK